MAQVFKKLKQNLNRFTLKRVMLIAQVGCFSVRILRSILEEFVIIFEQNKKIKFDNYPYSSRMGEKFCKKYVASTYVSNYFAKSSRENPKLIWKLSNIQWKIMNVQLNEFMSVWQLIVCCCLPFFTHSYLILPVVDLKLIWKSKPIWVRKM